MANSRCFVGRVVRYEPTPLGTVRAALESSGLEPYQVGHTMSFTNTIAGHLQAKRSDLPGLLLDWPPRRVTRLIAAALAAGGFESQSVRAQA